MTLEQIEKITALEIELAKLQEEFRAIEPDDEFTKSKYYILIRRVNNKIRNAKMTPADDIALSNEAKLLEYVHSDEYNDD